MRSSFQNRFSIYITDILLAIQHELLSTFLNDILLELIMIR